jgi:ferric-chelate reductase
VYFNLILVGALVPLLPTLTSLIHQSMFTPLKISVHYTRATATLPSIACIPGLTFSPGRPRIARTIDHAVQRALSIGVQHNTSDVARKGSKSEKVGRSYSGGSTRRERERDIATYGMKEGKKRSRMHGDVEMGEGMYTSRSGGGGGGGGEKEDIQDITGVVVAVCGPVELGKDVVDAVGSIDRERRNRVGGIEIHEE